MGKYAAAGVGTVADGSTQYHWSSNNKFNSNKPQAGYVFNGNQWQAPNSAPHMMSFDAVYNKANPFADEAKKYQNQLANLMANPGSGTSNPMYQHAFDQGLEAVNRTAAAKGQLGSGNRLAELVNYGQGQASQNFFKLADLYSELSGAKAQNPVGAVGAGLDLFAAQDRVQQTMNNTPVLTHSSGGGGWRRLY